MSKKDKKIEIQLTDAKVTVGKDSYEGYVLTIGKKVIGEIAELDSQFAIIKNGNVDSFYKKLDAAFPGLKEKYIQRYGTRYSVISPHNTRLMNIFHARCKENGIETNPDVIFAYLSAFDKIPGKTNAQLELF